MYCVLLYLDQPESIRDALNGAFETDVKNKIVLN